MNFLPQCLALSQQIPAQQATFQNNFHFCYSYWIEISGKFHLNLKKDLGQDMQKNICQSSEHWAPRKGTDDLESECRIFIKWCPPHAQVYFAISCHKSPLCQLEWRPLCPTTFWRLPVGREKAKQWEHKSSFLLLFFHGRGKHPFFWNSS